MKPYSTLALAAALAACTSTNPILVEAHETCRDQGGRDGALYAGKLNDDGQSIVIEGVGENELVGAQEASVISTVCILEATGAPDSIMSRIRSTSALTGQQEANHNGLTYRWTFHPDNGLDVIVELQE
jgi:hypothetical protein